MEESILKFGKELFVTFKRENINQYYEVIAKVSIDLARNWARGPLESCTRAESEAPRAHGGPSKKSRRLRSKISTC